MTKNLVRLQFDIRDYQFSARYSFILLTMVALALFLTLGFWQLARAKEKTLLQQTYEKRLYSPAISLAQLPKNTDLRYYRVQISGSFDNAHNLLIDNKIYNHQLGYEVVTPFLLDNGSVVLVNRGWVPAPQSRQELPSIPQETEQQTLIGMIYITPGKPFTLGKAIETGQTWPLRVQVLKISEIEKILNKPLYPFIVLLAPLEVSNTAASPFVRDWQPVNMPAYKHQGYAAQWFTFAVALIIIFIVLSVKRNEKPS